jgi:hypothetical protein
VAVLEGQIAQWSLPTRPSAATAGARRSWATASRWTPSRPAQLRELVESCITGHIDADRLGRLWAVEAAERQVLQSYAATLDGNGGDDADE